MQPLAVREVVGAGLAGRCSGGGRSSGINLHRVGSSSTPDFGTAWRFPTRKQAEDAALTYCHGNASKKAPAACSKTAAHGRRTVAKFCS